MTNRNEQMAELVAKHPIFEFKNKRNRPVKITLNTGDTVQAQPHSTVKVRSALFTNLPSQKDFAFVKPSLQDLIEVGIIKTAAAPGSAPAASAPAPTTPAPAAPPKPTPPTAAPAAPATPTSK